jgi:hypothetical protein
MRIMGIQYLGDIKPGDEIEYMAKVNQHGKKISHMETRRGKVIQKTGRFITIQGQRYPETILVNDLITGKAKLLKLIKEGYHGNHSRTVEGTEPYSRLGTGKRPGSYPG